MRTTTHDLGKPEEILQLKLGGEGFNGTLLVKGGFLVEFEQRPKCWCQYPEDQRFKNVFIVPPKGQPIPFQIKNCPTCGKAL